MLVASPDLIGWHGPLYRPPDCLRHRLLHDTTDNDCAIWFEAHGIEATEAVYGTQYGNDFLTVKAAIDGQWLALLNVDYVREGLASGTLVRALDIAWPTAVALNEVLKRPAVRTVVKWSKTDLR